MQYSDKDFILGMQIGFMDCVEWSEGEYIAENHTDTKYENGNGFSDEALKKIDEMVETFYKENKELLIESGLHPDYCGHDMCLTIKRHGTGFWDRDLGDVGEKLTKACEGLGFEVFANEQGLLEIE